LTSSAVEVGLYSSTKSLVYVAPELPPPPYASLITRPVPAVLAEAGAASRPLATTVAADASTRQVRALVETRLVIPRSPL
jgi:hypothetical protein